MEYENIVFITFSIINIILFSIIFASFILFKPKLSKQDTLFSQKYFIQFCFCAVTLCQLVYSSQLEIKNEISNYQWKLIGYSAYFIFLFVISFAINYENYLSTRDPTHVFRILISKGNNYLFGDLIILSIICSYTALGLILNSFKEEYAVEDTASELFFRINVDYILNAFLFFVSAITVVFYPLNRMNFKNYNFTSNNNFINSNKYSLLITCFYLLYSAYMLFARFIFSKDLYLTITY